MRFHFINPLHTHYLLSYLSKSIPDANPPSAQAVKIANRLFSLIILLAAVVIILPPVAPKGCPIAKEPPNVLVTVISNLPTFSPIYFSPFI